MTVIIYNLFKAMIPLTVCIIYMRITSLCGVKSAHFPLEFGDGRSMTTGGCHTLNIFRLDFLFFTGYLS